MEVEKEKHIVRDKKRLGIGFFTFARATDAQRYATTHSAYVLIEALVCL